MIAETKSRRTAAVAALAFAAGFAAGLLFARSPAPPPDPGPIRTVDPAPAVPEAAPSPRAAAAPANRRDADPVAVARAEAASTPPAAAPAGERSPERGLVAAWFEVTVRSEEGAPKGTVYALPAGSAGADTGKAPSGGVPEEGPARLPVTAEGVYDVGFVSDDWGSALATDQRIAAGETRSVELSLPVREPVSFRCYPPLAREDAGARPKVLLVYAGAAPRWSLPGRGSVRMETASEFELNAAGVGFTRPLPPDLEYLVVVRFEESRPNFEAVYAGLVLEPDPPRARAGDTVTLRAREAVEVTLRPAPQAPWPRRPLWMCVLLKQENRTRGFHGAGAGLDEEGNVESAVVPALAGPAVVEWSGEGVAPGRIEVVVRSGEAQRFDLPVAFDPAGKADCADRSASFDEVAVVVSGIPEGTPSRQALRLAVLSPGDGPWARYTGALSAPLDPAEPQQVSERWLLARTLGAYYGIEFASDPIPAPLRGPLRVVLKPAGLLAAVPEEAFPPELGELRVRRKDGYPIPLPDVDKGLVDQSVDELPVWMGALLGPFPEGSWTFEVLLGSLRLPDATAEVRSGKTRPLVLRR